MSRSISSWARRRTSERCRGGRARPGRERRGGARRPRPVGVADAAGRATCVDDRRRVAGSSTANGRGRRSSRCASKDSRRGSSSASCEQLVADRQRRQEAQHVAVGAAGQHDDALLVRGGRDRAARASGSGSSVPASTSSTAIMAPRPRTSPMRGRRRPAARAAGSSMSVLDLAARAATRPSASIVSMAASAAAQASGLPPYVPPRPPTCGGVHDLGAAGHRRQRQPAGDALGGDDQVGHDALVVAGEHVARAGEAGLHLVGDEDHAVGAAPVGERGQEARGRHDEAALALDRLDHDGGEVVGADLLLDHVDRAQRGRRCRRRPPSR